MLYVCSSFAIYYNHTRAFVVFMFSSIANSFIKQVPFIPRNLSLEVRVQWHNICFLEMVLVMLECFFFQEQEHLEGCLLSMCDVYNCFDILANAWKLAN